MPWQASYKCICLDNDIACSTQWAVRVGDEKQVVIPLQWPQGLSKASAMRSLVGCYRLDNNNTNYSLYFLGTVPDNCQMANI